MSQFDVFNGDGDGICALHQLRLDFPRESTLVTGVKRDIALLERVDAGEGDRVTVLDISLAANRNALLRLLERGVEVDYFDHHYAGAIPTHPRLRATIDTAANVCTAMIVDRHLDGRYRAWAVVGAYADDLIDSAEDLARSLDFDAAQCTVLRELGETIAYNAYGDNESDLIVHPAVLYGMIHRYADPLVFFAEAPLWRRIAQQRRNDLQQARRVKPAIELRRARIYVLPDAAWSRRVRGTLANELCNRDVDVAHAVLTGTSHEDYAVSVRAPLSHRSGADALCRKFATGGGRAGAAGINHLPRERLTEFTRELDRAFPG